MLATPKEISSVHPNREGFPYYFIGNKSLLNQFPIAVFCSREIPLSIYNTANETFGQMLTLPLVIGGGWQSTMEKRVLKNYTEESQARIIYFLAKGINHYKIPGHLSYLIGCGRLLIVSPFLNRPRIGNPPYGVKVADSVKNDFGLGNKDSYGIFTALGLKILRPGGTLCFIMSDTWQTIKTHKPLRDKLLSEADCQYLISCPSDTFGATVNVGVYTFKKRPALKEGGENWILAADFSPLSIEKGELEAAFEILAEQNDFDETEDGYTIYSDRDMAIFTYRQKLITRFSNHSFFIASPKLFGLMKDVGNMKIDISRKDKPPVYSVEFNGKGLELAKLEDVAEVKHGLTTGDNYKYVFKKETARGTYRIVDFNLILTNKDMEKLTPDEKQSGFDKNKFNGRYLVPYDKGGSSETGDGWLPNYYVPTEYFIDWQRAAVDAMKKLPGHRHDNPRYYFKKGITYSITGIYAPTFRL